jgi:hypothetical protein
VYCGSGVASRLLTGAGFEVLGIGAAEALLRRARREAPAWSSNAPTSSAPGCRPPPRWSRSARCCPAAEVAAALRGAGFSVRFRRVYAGERFAPGHYVVEARARPRRGTGAD